MKLGIDTAFFGRLGLEESLAHLADIRWTDVQISSGHLDPLMDDDDALKRLRGTCELLGVTVWQVHSGAELGSSESDLADNLKWLDCTVAIGARCLITHANQDADYNTEIERQRCLEVNRDCLAKVYSRARDLDVQVAIENRLERPWATCKRFGARMQDFLDLIDAAGADGAGICLDTSHTRVSRLSFTEEIALAGSRLFATQLSDSDGETQHRLPFTFDMDWEEIFASLRGFGYDGLLTLDCGGAKGASIEELDVQLDEVRKRFEPLLDE